MRKAFVRILVVIALVTSATADPYKFTIGNTWIFRDGITLTESPPQACGRSSVALMLNGFTLFHQFGYKSLAIERSGLWLWSPVRPYVTGYEWETEAELHFVPHERIESRLFRTGYPWEP